MGNFWWKILGGKFLVGNFWWEIFDGEKKKKKTKNDDVTYRQLNRIFTYRLDPWKIGKFWKIWKILENLKKIWTIWKKFGKFGKFWKI